MIDEVCKREAELLLNLLLALREGAENGDPKHLRDVEALGNICAMIDRGVLLFVDEGVIEKEYGNFRESEHYFGFLRVCVYVCHVW